MKNLDDIKKETDIQEFLSFASSYLKYVVTTCLLASGFFALLIQYPKATLIVTAIFTAILITCYKLLLKWLKNSMTPEEEKNVLHAYWASQSAITNEKIKDLKKSVKNKS